MPADRCFIRKERDRYYCPKCTARWDFDETPECVRKERAAPVERLPFASGLPFIVDSQH